MTTPSLAEHRFDRGRDAVVLHEYPPPQSPLVDERGRTTITLILPAMGVPAGYYRPFAEHLRERGLRVFVLDLRGTGSSLPRPGRGCRYGYTELLGDVQAALDSMATLAASDAVPAPDPPGPADPPAPGPAGPAGPTADDPASRPRLLLIGHSLGGQLALLASATHPRADAIALVACGVPYWRGYGQPTRWILWVLSRIIAPSSALIGHWPGWGFAGRQSVGVIGDWAYTARLGRLPELAGVDPAPQLAALDLPVLTVGIDGDILTPPHTLDRLLDFTPNIALTRIDHLDDRAPVALTHLNWPRHSEEIAQRIVAWFRTTRDPDAAFSTAPRRQTP